MNEPCPHERTIDRFDLMALLEGERVDLGGGRWLTLDTDDDWALRVHGAADEANREIHGP